MDELMHASFTGAIIGVFQGLYIFFRSAISSPPMIILFILIILKRLSHKLYH